MTEELMTQVSRIYERAQECRAMPRSSYCPLLSDILKCCWKRECDWTLEWAEFQISLCLYDRRMPRGFLNPIQRHARPAAHMRGLR
jgi:hypothetical protein